MKPKKILILGGSGMLGSDLREVAIARYGQACCSAPARRELDALDENGLQRAVTETRPDWIINAIAYTQVDLAETERARAQELNAVLPKRLAAIARLSGARLLHFSTDQVFDGTASTPRSETDTAQPANFYAESKLHGDEAVLGLPLGLVLRVQWLYGKQKDRFTPLKDKAVFTPFSDQVGCPTWTRDIAEAAFDLLEKEATGLFHFAYDDSASWAEVFGFVIAEMNYPTRLVPKRTAEVSLPARRPLYSVLSNRKVAEALGRPLGRWRDRMKVFLHSGEETSR